MTTPESEPETPETDPDDLDGLRSRIRLLESELGELRAARGVDAERIRELGAFADLFESARQGLVVLSAEGQVLRANAAARSLLSGAGHSGPERTHFTEHFALDAREELEETLVGLLRGQSRLEVELALGASDRDAPGRVVEVAFSPLGRHRGLSLATLRDVTEARALLRELSSTRSFLERVIESSADGIVSADLDGTVLVYNEAAARLFGYDRIDVIGKMNVRDLYPEGTARDVLRKIRSPEFGGRGRLDDYRVDLLSRSGERIPVMLSATLVMDGSSATGTVGFFTDVREKLALEARLSVAQQELQNHERLAALAELAGAAAHELNQPLTSVMGYAEYLKRLLPAGSPLERPVEVILSETERMAGIVRKVGRITKYETKVYVGQAKIVDLDASSRDSGEYSRPAADRIVPSDDLPTDTKASAAPASDGSEPETPKPSPRESD